MVNNMRRRGVRGGQAGLLPKRNKCGIKSASALCWPMIGLWYSIPPRIFQTLTAWVLRPLLHVFCGFEVKGIDNLRGLRQAVFALNHTSELDPLILAAALPRTGPFAQIFFVSTPTKHFRDKSYGWHAFFYREGFFNMIGSYALVEGQHDYIRSLATHDKIMRDGMSLAIFPEGRISKTGELGEVHGGGAFMAHTHSVPLIPVKLSGVHQISPRRFFGRKHTITLEFGTPCNVNAIMRSQKMYGIEHPYSVIMQRVMTGTCVYNEELKKVRSKLSFKKRLKEKLTNRVNQPREVIGQMA